MMTEEQHEKNQELPADLPPEIQTAIKERGGLAGIAADLPDDVCAEEQSVMHRACTDPVRLKILALLQGGPLCVCVIKTLLDQPDSRLSYHLSVLKKAGLIDGTPCANWIIYRLTPQGSAWMGCVCASRDLSLQRR